MPPETEPQSGERAPLRVVLLNSIPHWGGGEKWCVQTARALGARGHRVVVACGSGTELERRARGAELEVWSRPLGGVRGLAAARRLARFLREEEVEVLVANVNRDVRLGALACRRSRARLVQRRGIARPIGSGFVARRLYTGPVRRILVNCRAIRDEMASSADWVDRGRFAVVPNGVDTSTVPPAGALAAARAELGLVSDRPVASIVARLAPMKGHAHLLAAWPDVRERVPGALLLVAGTGESEAELRALAARRDLGDSVRFLGFREDPRPVLAASDLFVLASVRDEGCNNTLLEAMWQGLPAVVTRCGGLPEQVVEGRTGRIVPIGDDAALARAVGELLADPGLRAEMSRAARERVEEHYSLAVVTDRLEEVLRSVRDGP